MPGNSIAQPLRVTTLGDLLLAAAEARPEADAVVLPDGRLSYRELAERAWQYARALQALGVRPRDHVGLLLPTCLEFPEFLFAIALCGAVTVPINARFRAGELAYVIGNSDVVTLVTTDTVAEHVDFVERLCEGLPGLADAPNPLHLALPGAPRLRNVVLLGHSGRRGFVAGRDLGRLADSVPVEAVEETRIGTWVRQPALMLYTSGTTANPKGCPLSHEAIVRNSSALGHRYRLGPEDRFWSPLPMFHIAAILPLLAIFDVAGAYLTMTHFEAGAALRMLEEERATATYPCFVTIMSDLIHHPDFARRDLGRVRLMNANFAVQPPGIREAMLAAMPQAIYVGTYGMTETAGTVCTSEPTDDLDARCNRLGTPLPGLEVRIVDPATGQDVPCGARGEILVRGYCLFDGYYKDPEKTAQVIDAEGFFHTGDIGSLDERGQIMFHGRYKDMLKVGGENVAAAEIEAFLAGHPGVKLVQVVGVPDARLQEVAAAFVELEPGAALTEAELIGYCKGSIASFKVPRYVRFVTEWPMSASKIQKFRLREQLVSELAAGGTAGES
jgi:acyl-CoA synthetase (AMP-forming)/AMP-acid ligase II